MAQPATPYNFGMRVLLQQPGEDREAPRFVRLLLEPDLLGGWQLVRETGTVGGRSSVRREQFLDRDEALGALQRSRDQQLKKGYVVLDDPAADPSRP